MTFNPQSDASVESILAELRGVAETAFDKACPIPAGINHSREFFEHEQRRVFQQEWICMGREDEIANPGDYLTHTIGDVPVLVVRSKSGEVNAFINACAHRFACLVPDRQGSAKKFTCRYHAWTYDTQGQLVAAPYMDMKPGFSLADHRLQRLHHCIWQGFLYVTLAQDPPQDLNVSLAPLTDNVVGRYGMPLFRTIIRDQMEWKANWKNLMENFIESYHVPMAHGNTFAKHDKPLGDYVCGEDSDFYCYHRAPQESDSGLGAAHPDNDRLEGEWRRMMIDFSDRKSTRLDSSHQR